MLIGIEFKRKKVYDIEENRSYWYWRVAPYCRGIDHERFVAIVFAVLCMAGVVLIGSIVGGGS
jgi:hypothetical protein